MAAADELLELAGDLYEAAHNPSLWEGVVCRLCRSFSGEGMALLVLDLSRRHVLFRAAYQQPSGRLSHELLADAPRLSGASDSSAPPKRLPPYEVSPCERTLRHTFRALLDEGEARWWLVAHVWEDSGGGAAVAADGVLLARWRALVPHLQRAIRMGQQLQRLQHQAAAAGALDTFAFGILLLDAGGRVLHMNRQAEEQLARGDGLRLTRAGTVVAGRECVRDGLAALIAQAVGRPGIQCSLALPRRIGATPYLLQAVPLSAGRPPSGSAPPAATLIVRELDSLPALSAAGLRRLFRLTPREAEVTLRLTRGCTLGASSAQLGISAKTARHHLAAVFRKTGTRRQVELVTLVRTLGGTPLRTEA